MHGPAGAELRKKWAEDREEAKRRRVEWWLKENREAVEFWRRKDEADKLKELQKEMAAAEAEIEERKETRRERRREWERLERQKKKRRGESGEVGHAVFVVDAVYSRCGHWD